MPPQRAETARKNSDHTAGDVIMSKNRGVVYTKGSSINNSANSVWTVIFSMRRNRIVPVAMERVAGQVDGSHLEIGNLDAFGIFLFVELGAHLEAAICCRRGDQLDDRAIAAQWFSPPVDGDEREETMLDLVPLAGAGRQVANRDRQLELVRQFLKLDLPQAQTIAVAAAAVGGDHQALACRMTLLPHRPPPSADRIDREAGGVVVRADADPADIVGDIVHAVGHGAV